MRNKKTNIICPYNYSSKIIWSYYDNIGEIVTHEQRNERKNEEGKDIRDSWQFDNIQPRSHGEN